jgi:phospholipid-binding lipoprotein MlaA
MNPSRTSIVAFLALLLCLFSKPCTGRAETVSDPLQPLNRKIFWFNEKVDIYVLEPAARAYDHAVPDRIQTSVTNFFNNLYFLVNFTNSALQAKPVDAGRALVRFLLNTVGGMGGLFDPATSLGLPLKFEDVGQTLGYWGVPPGPYLVLPLLGPSNVRDAFGRAADSALLVYPYFVPIYVSFGGTAFEVVNFRASVLGDIEAARRAALDYYVFVRNAYGQRRRALIDDSTVGEEQQEDLYDVDYDDSE